MLSTNTEPPGARHGTRPGPTGRRPAARRRRIASGLAAATATAALVGTSSGPARLLAAVLFASTVSYVVAGACARRRAVHRDVARAFAGPGGSFDWAALANPEAPDGPGGTDPGVAWDGLSPAEQHAALDVAGGADLVRFAASSLLGWVLTPLAVAVRLAAGDRRDLTGDGALARLVALQRDGRAHSLRALALSLATTAGVGAVGSVAGVAAPAAAAAPAPGTVTVAEGDTLSAIAAAHGTTVAALAHLNALASPDVVRIGQVLSLPAVPGLALPTAAPAGGPASGSGTYTVQPGDTLSAIAASHATTVAALVAANHIANPDLITPGEVLTLPAGSGTPSVVPAPAPAPEPSGDGSGVAATALSVALAQVGKPYQWAGAGPATFDCSGLVMYAYAAAGVSLPHYSVSQYDDTTRITEAQLEPGDLVFYGGSAPSHVAMYAGGGDVVSADTTGTDVRVEPMTWDGTPSGFGRVA